MFRLSFLIAMVSLLVGLLFAANWSTGAASGGPSVVHQSERILVKFRPDITGLMKAQIHERLNGRVLGEIDSLDVEIVDTTDARDRATAYMREPAVEYAEVDAVASAIDVPDDPYFSTFQWNLTKVLAPQAWDLEHGRVDVRIGILDTGVALGHPDLALKIAGSANFSSSATVEDMYGHGTHVAGIAAAATNNGIGVAGLGYQSSIVNVKVLGDNGSGYYSWVANGIVWAANNGLDVINLSLGGTVASQTLEDAINYAWNKGVVIVAASGNSGSTAPQYPAYYQNAIAVAATDSGDRLASWSNRGEWVDLAAPGVSVYSTKIGDTYGTMSGTSMASPHVAGLAALVLARTYDANADGRRNDEARSCVERTADDIGISGIGTGRINAYRAVQCNAVGQTGAITGLVRSGVTGAGIAGAAVTDGLLTVWTDASGTYALADHQTGTFTISASAAGYESASQPVTVAAGLMSTVDFNLAPVPPAGNSVWVDSIGFALTGNNLRIDLKVVSDAGPVAGQTVDLEVVRDDSQTWYLAGTTDSGGIAHLTIKKAPIGRYVATVRALTGGNYGWDDLRGVTSSVFVVGARSG